MRIKRRIRWVIVTLLLCGLCHTVAFAYGYDKNDPSRSWGYQPVYKPGLSQPTYHFYSTSPYIQSMGESKAHSYGMNSKPRRSGGIPNDDEDDEIGIVHPDREEMPVGDTPWLLVLLLIAGYKLTKRYRTIHYDAYSIRRESCRLRGRRHGRRR